MYFTLTKQITKGIITIKYQKEQIMRAKGDIWYPTIVKQEFANILFSPGRFEAMDNHRNYAEEDIIITDLEGTVDARTSGIVNIGLSFKVVVGVVKCGVAIIIEPPVPNPIDSISGIVTSRMKYPTANDSLGIGVIEVIEDNLLKITTHRVGQVDRNPACVEILAQYVVIDEKKIKEEVMDNILGVEETTTEPDVEETTTEQPDTDQT